MREDKPSKDNTGSLMLVLIYRLYCFQQKSTLSLVFQFDAVKKYVEKGGSLLVLMGEGGESKFNTNINFLLEEYGIMVNNGKRELSFRHTSTFKTDKLLDK